MAKIPIPTSTGFGVRGIALELTRHQQARSLVRIDPSSSVANSIVPLAPVYVWPVSRSPPDSVRSQCVNRARSSGCSRRFQQTRQLTSRVETADRVAFPAWALRLMLVAFVLAWIFGPIELRQAVPIWIPFAIALGLELSFVWSALRAPHAARWTGGRSPTTASDSATTTSRASCCSSTTTIVSSGSVQGERGGARRAHRRCARVGGRGRGRLPNRRSPDRDRSGGRCGASSPGSRSSPRSG